MKNSILGSQHSDPSRISPLARGHSIYCAFIAHECAAPPLFIHIYIALSYASFNRDFDTNSAGLQSGHMCAHTELPNSDSSARCITCSPEYYLGSLARSLCAKVPLASFRYIYLKFKNICFKRDFELKSIGLQLSTLACSPRAPEQHNVRNSLLLASTFDCPRP